MHRSDAVLKGSKVLVVDDDMRNIFALASVLEEHGMTVISAGNGRDACSIMATAGADRHRADGHHDARDGRHRHHARGAQDAVLPRPADHRRHGQGHEGRPRACIEAGAWDYLSKPVDPQHMLAVLRSWLYR